VQFPFLQGRFLEEWKNLLVTVEHFGPLNVSITAEDISIGIRSIRMLIGTVLGLT
jgi:hypothetical protein